MLKLSFYFLFALLSTFTFCLMLLRLYIVPQLPDVHSMHTVRLQVPLRIYSQDGSLIAEYGEKRRIPVRIADLPQSLVQAFIAAEDDRFYEHPGVDWQGIMRAGYFLLRDRKKTQGGSTITMQLAKNLFLTRERTYRRKLMEIMLALRIESILNKDQIMEHYLNKIHFGNRAYGVGAAAKVYYGRDVRQLDLAQIAMLAGLITAPSRDNPIRNPDKALARRNYVLRRMLEKGFIDMQQFQTAKARPATASLHKTDLAIEAPYVAEMVRLEMLERFGEAAYTEGLIVVTSLRDKYQIAANQAVRSALLQYDIRHGYRGAEAHIPLAETEQDSEKWTEQLASYRTIGGLHPALVTQVWDSEISVFIVGIGTVVIPWSGLQWAQTSDVQGVTSIVARGDVIRVTESDKGEWQLAQLPKVQGSLVSINVNNGALLALVGGFDFAQSKFNRATQSRRQPGSGFKPFIYSAALAHGKTAASIINDAPIVHIVPGQQAWRPRNYSRKTYGPTRLREGLVKSRNLVSVRLLDEIGISKSMGYIEKFGFDTARLPKTLSLALGSGEVSVWEMARAYSVFANGGYLIDPWFIQSVTGADETKLFQSRPKTVCQACNATPKHTKPEPLVTSSGPFAGKQQKSGDGSDDGYKIADTSSATLGSPTQNIENPAPLIIDRRVAYIMNSIIQDVIKRGTGRRALSLQRQDIGGKTGTTNDQNDAWFSGYNGEIATVCWVGFDARKSLGRNETGARAALPMWIHYMSKVLHGTAEVMAPRPEGLVSVKINPHDGTPSYSNNSDAIFELFREESLHRLDAQTIPAPDNTPVATPEQLF